jgi:hypothetical protein
MALAALLAASAFSLPAAAGPDQQETAPGMARREPAPTPVTVRENGARQKHLGESRMVYSVVKRDASGKLGMQCLAGEEAANAALDRPAPAIQPEHSHETR